jgi:hypothetical protein
MSSVLTEIFVVVVGFLSLKGLRVEDLKIVQSFGLRIRADRASLRASGHDTDEVIGEEARGEVHSERGV